MKIAVIGSGPLALYASAHFYQLGAHVVLFQRSALGGNLRFCVSKNIQGVVDYPEEKSYEKFWKEDLVPLIEHLEERKITKVGDVLRVHKRFLHRDEEVLNRSRLVDLFRVIYTTNPKESILKQVEENPELFKQLGEDVLNSLHEPVESFEDFDIVIEATGLGKSEFKMGPSGTYALNEKNLNKHGHFYYGKDFFNYSDIDKHKNILVVGDSIGAYLTILKLEAWLFSKPEHKLTWIKHNQSSLENSLVSSVIKKSENDFEQKKSIFESELRKWRDLDDFVKAKIAKPVEPEKKFYLYEGYNVTSVDKLLDREGVFVTIESPDFRSYVTTHSDLKTIPCDIVVVQNGVDENENLGVNLKSDEPGHYMIQSNSIKEGMLQILEVEKKILQFFSREDQ